MTSLTWDAVLAWRMRRQHLAERAPAAAALDVVSDIAGLHAQVVLQRGAHPLGEGEGSRGRAWLERALWEERALVKTWAMRGTLHLLRADELARYVGALSRLKPRHHVGAWLRHHGLTRAQADAMLAAIPRRSTAEPLTREALAAAVAERAGEEALVEKLGGGFGDLLKPAAFTGDLCFAPSDGPARALHAAAALARRLHAARARRGGRGATSSARTCARTAPRRASSSSAGSG